VEGSLTISVAAYIAGAPPVLANRGLSDGVTEGMEFDIIRGNTIVGRAVVTSAFADDCELRLLQGANNVRPQDTVRERFTMPPFDGR
jgi:hypothetical protein